VIAPAAYAGIAVSGASASSITAASKRAKKPLLWFSALQLLILQHFLCRVVMKTRKISPCTRVVLNYAKIFPCFYSPISGKIFQRSEYTPIGKKKFHAPFWGIFFGKQTRHF
jgi:hypothetical protein